MADLPRGFSGGSDLWDGPLGNSVFFEEFVTDLPTYVGFAALTSLWKGPSTISSKYVGT